MYPVPSPEPKTLFLLAASALSLTLTLVQTYFFRHHFSFLAFTPASGQENRIESIIRIYSIIFLLIFHNLLLQSPSHWHKSQASLHHAPKSPGRKGLESRPDTTMPVVYLNVRPSRLKSLESGLACLAKK